tara:strand:+ start:9500 stop:9655 length:156 start_codon:yes stop_codon:yes gene_type:complete
MKNIPTFDMITYGEIALLAMDHMPNRIMDHLDLSDEEFERLQMQLGEEMEK